MSTLCTRAAYYQIGQENANGISDYLPRAIGIKLTHQLTHETIPYSSPVARL